jgi:hypothetical protein
MTQPASTFLRADKTTGNDNGSASQILNRADAAQSADFTAILLAPQWSADSPPRAALAGATFRQFQAFAALIRLALGDLSDTNGRCTGTFELRRIYIHLVGYWTYLEKPLQNLTTMLRYNTCTVSVIARPNRSAT